MLAASLLIAMPLLLLLLSSCMQSTLTPMAPAVPLADLRGRIAFISSESSYDSGMLSIEGSGTLCIVNADGSGLTKLADNVLDASWSPDGERVAFSSDRTGAAEVYVMNADGSAVARLTDGQYDSASIGGWSPDSQCIAFHEWTRPHWRAYLMSADGSDIVEFYRDTLNPMWSPDGTRIAFEYEPIFRRQIWLANRGGSKAGALTDDEEDEYLLAWTPDGTQIAYVSSSGDNTKHEYRIVVANADGSGIAQMLGDLGPRYCLRLSPDGTRIAFVAARVDERSTLRALIDYALTASRTAYDRGTEIHVMNADGTDQVRLTDDLDHDCYPIWSPDGRYIAFESDGDRSHGIYVTAADGRSGPTRMINTDSLNVLLCWLPD